MHRRLDSIARAERTTLITGPTGAGKDVVAQALHGRSRRATEPFVVVQCAALPDNLVEAELFGHSRGAFTGAVTARDGLVRTAEQGTLFLDEIDSLSLGAQAKLLRFLETGEFRPVGADRTERSQAWVVAATNQDLHARVRHGQFREDLLYRLEVVCIAIPPLRQRRGDIPALAAHFLEEVGQGHKQLSAAAQAALQAYDWPGNVRELRHRVEAAALLGEGDVIDVADLGLPGGDEARAAALGEEEAGERGERGERAGEGAGGAAGTLPSSPPGEPSSGERTLPPGWHRPRRAAATDAPRAAAPGLVSPGAAGAPGAGLEGELWRLVNDRGMSLAEATAICESMLVRAALRAEGDNRTRAAARLGINVRTIYKKLPR